MININIDGKEIQGYRGQTILELAQENNIQIPTLCHDERIKTYGACGICVVEVEGNNRLLRSCATEITPGMVVTTDSARIRASRKMTLELMLSDHSGDCRPPCVKACPAQTDCQGYVGLIANGEYLESLKLIKEQLPLPASIGLVCPHPCEDACRRQLVEEPISIAALKVFAAEQDIYKTNAFVPDKKESTGQQVAIIGAGPAGLTAAHFLAIEGHAVTIYEAMPQAGGMLRYGIPQYRLPKEILDQEIKLIEALGVKIICNTKINQDISFDYIRQKYDAVFIGIGAWKYTRIGCTGEDVAGVVGGIDFLRDAALHGDVGIGEKVAVIGGGNTAMDAARTAVRLGAREVMVLYRRTREEMPAEDIEIKEAEEEGVVFKFLLAPEEILAEDGKATAIRCQKMQLGEPDSSGRRRPVPIEGAQEVIPVDTIIAAIGQQVDASDLPGLQLDKWKCIDTHAGSLQTNLDGVFAGGDAVTGPGIAIEAIAQGKKAALAMDAYLKGESLPLVGSYTVERNNLTAADFAEVAKEARINIVHRDPVQRRQDFLEIAGRMTPEQARQEAARCLECGCMDYFECKLIKYAGEYQVDPTPIQGNKHPVTEHDEHPYIERDAAKCILCGLCVRICDEMMGVGALGLVHRGFDTLVKPEFGRALQDSPCISCGQCVSVCPTGALVERNPRFKSVPLKLAENNSYCSFCGLNCGQTISSRGDAVVRIEPAAGEILCSKGRFGFTGVSERLTQPMLRVDGKLQESTWDETLQYIAKKSLAVKAKNEKDCLAIFASPSLTIEEAQMAASWQTLLNTDKLGSFSPDGGRGLFGVLGDNLSSNSLDEINGTDLILMLGSFNENQVLPARIRKAVGQGAQLIVLSPEKTLVDDLARLKACPPDSTSFIKEILACVIAQNLVNSSFIEERTTGYQELSSALKTLTPGETAQQIASLYANATKAMILVDGYNVTAAAIELLADLAVLTGKIGSPRNGIIVINPGGNASGIWQAGFKQDSRELLKGIEDGVIKAAFILGEDPVGAGVIEESYLTKMDFVMVASPFKTATTELADAVLPLSAPWENDGSYLTADGKVVSLQAVKAAPAGQNNLQIWSQLSQILNPHGNNRIVKLDLARTKPYLYPQSFAGQDGKAQLKIGEDGPIFKKAKITDPILIRVKGK
ncbi:Molybdopterin oxidoreductase [Syntrophomonas zehnderi OL-4]|uniref:Molybdopterin oxidoreductase n=1 Tax=Syntrophomonas zehnderi OL-4 TaxID=690567 RepID=A0A0E4G9S8_9FIRM|nr:FAD-dependent oxidoreductase [Syntrophomonas zehnderi]CFX22265.1 Molybdopterin oxidoreductase [Syntrophomonas zehnderi OL-4]